MKKEKLIKNLILIIILFSYHLHITSQTTFNKDLKIMNFISDPGSVVTYGDTIICIGYGTDINPYKFYNSYLTKFDMEGNMLQRYTDVMLGDYFYDSDHSYIKGDTLINSPTLIEWDSTGGEWKRIFNGGYVILTDISSGEIIKKIKISSISMDDRRVAIVEFTKIDSVTFAVMAYIVDDNPNFFWDTQISIVNIETDSVRNLVIRTKNIDDLSSSIIWNGEKLIVGAGHSWDTDPSNLFSIYKSIGYIYEVDTSGIYKKVFQTDTMWGFPAEMMLDEDGNYVYLTSFSKYFHDTYLDRYYRHSHHYLVKLDKNYNLVWERPIGLEYDYRPWYGWTGDVLADQDGDGYIVATSQANYKWDIDDFEWDSIQATGNSPKIVGILTKVSEDGEKKWMRTYSIVNDTSINSITHKIKDVTYAPDGGYIAFGALDYDGHLGIDTVANYHAWLFKVDKYGCLVPGCQEGDSTKVDNIGLDLKIKLYPNPVSDRLYIYQTASGYKHYTITDISGRKINYWSGNLNNHTYIVDVSRYKSGVYILNVVDDTGRRGSRKFIVK